MNTQEYILSGIIEAYAMGIATEEEASILECIQKHNSEVRQAVLEAQLALEDLADAAAVPPPPALKANVWEKIQQNEDGTEAVVRQLYLNDEIKPGKNSSTINYKTWAIAASIVGVLSLGTMYFYATNQQQKANNRIALLDLKQKDTETALNQLQQKWEMSSSPNMRVVPLPGVEKHPGMMAVVYFDNSTNQSYLTIENLPPPPPDQQYQLWAIVDGKPVSAGVYDQLKNEPVQRMLAIANPQAFAITLEKQGGSISPTMENMFVMGKI